MVSLSNHIAFTDACHPFDKLRVTCFFKLKKPYHKRKMLYFLLHDPPLYFEAGAHL